MVLNEDAPVFVDGIACWAREAHFGGIVVQPVAGWLKSAYPRDLDRWKTLSDFRFNGRAVLEELIGASPWGSSDQVLASLSIFPHPDVVTAANRRAIFRTKRGTADRGKIVDGVMSDDNHSPAMAFKWSTQFKPPSGSDLTCCHLYAASGDPDAYTDVRNLFLVPSFIAKLTDSQATVLPPHHALHALRYRAFALYGYCGPKSTSPPDKPDRYNGLEWADTVGAGTDTEDLERRLRARLARKPKDRITKSVAQCGWTFSDYEPDSLVVYSGS